MGYKKKVVVVTSDPLALVAKKTKVSKRKEKVVLQSDSEGSDDEDISDMKKIIALLAKAFNQNKYYAKPINNNLRTSSANKKPDNVKSEEQKEDKKADEKKRDMSKVRCYNCKKEGHFAKDYKKAKVKNYNYYKTKMLLAKKDDDEQVLLAEFQVVDATDDSSAIPEHTTVETPMNITPENKAHFEVEKEVIHLILTGIGDEIYSTVDACQTAQEIWEAIKRLARNTNPLTLVATAQSNQDPYNKISKSHKSYAPSSKPTIPARSHTSTRHKGNEIAKPITPLSETSLEEDSDPEQAQRDKDMQKNLALIEKYFKKIYKPTNNNLKTSSNSRNKNVDMTPRYKNDNQSGQFGNQRTMNVVRARENVGSPVVQQSGIQCFNCKEFGHFAKECRKPKRVKDFTYHKEKMLLCKQAEQGVPLQAEQYDWLADTDEEVDEQELEAHYSYMAKIQEVPTVDTGTDSEPVEQIQKQLKKANTTLAQELKECKAILAETSKSLGESISVRDSFLVALQNKQSEFEKYKAFNDRTIDYDKLEHLKLRKEHDIDKMLSMEKQLKFLNEIVYKKSQSIQTIHMMAPKVPTYNGRPTFANPRYLKQAQSEIQCLYAFPYNQSTHANRLIPDEEETLALERESRSKLNKDLVRPYDYTTLNSL
nr:hypothetical protein [Tanacetum cinerariifolium]